MNERAWRIARELKERIKPLYGDRLKEVVVFGSYARGEETPESDLDVAIVLEPLEKQMVEWKRMSKVIVEYSVEQGFVLDVHFISFVDWKNGTFAFQRQVKREGQLV